MIIIIIIIDFNVFIYFYEWFIAQIWDINNETKTNKQKNTCMPAWPNW